MRTDGATSAVTESAQPVEAFEPPWQDQRQRVDKRWSRGRRALALVILLVAGAAAWWLPCWRGRMASCNFWCTVGSAGACNVLARNHDEGDGTDVRDDLAVSFYRQACDGGNVTACENLGIMYENAEGVAPDPAAAALHFERACPTKVSACRRLAALYVAGQITTDSSVASTLERACDGHDDDAMRSCNALARMFDVGRGVPRDDRHAVRLYRRACDGHLDVACYNLSLMYRRGEGVDRDVAEADALEQISCRTSTSARCRSR